MPTKLSPEMCYLAGIVSKTRQEEKSMVGVTTTIDAMIENFVELALKLGIDSKKIVIEDMDGMRHVYFFHSKIAKEIREITEKETKIFKYKNSYSSSFLAGMYDASGKVRNGKVSISRLTRADELMLQNLGIHTKGSSIMNIKYFFDFIKEHSILMNER
ncbi:MAG TPA: hypothetical protein VNF06_03075 [Candidatus Aquilonibacter sp.]|nr:hypothetical protein [Candidatus Aquilonibacter sp.]